MKVLQYNVYYHAGFGSTYTKIGMMYIVMWNKRKRKTLVKTRKSAALFQGRGTLEDEELAPGWREEVANGPVSLTIMGPLSGQQKSQESLPRLR
jgi:hypothetical protein